MVNKVDALIQRLENLVSNRISIEQEEHPNTKPTLSTPIKQLSPNCKKDIRHLLKETAESMEVRNVDLDISQSSVELVLSLMKEAAKQCGNEENNWPRKLKKELTGGGDDRSRQTSLSALG